MTRSHLSSFQQERERWEQLGEDDEAHKRRTDFVPAKHDALRKVPAYRDFIKERFERCLDLYLAPRARKMRLTIQPEDLLPQLPSPAELQPFPTACALTYRGHNNAIRCAFYIKGLSKMWAHCYLCLCQDHRRRSDGPIPGVGQR